MPYDNRNSGVLFKNDRKEKDTHPDYTGKLDVGGVAYQIAAWIRTGKSGKNEGKKFMSLQIKPDDGSGRGEKKEPQDDGIPF
jgi:hypothetical protein